MRTIFSVLLLVLMFRNEGNLWAEELNIQPTDFKSSEPVKPSSRLFRTFGFSMFAAAAGDVASTEWALSKPNAFEQNPLMSNRAVRISTHAFVPLAAWWTTERMEKQGLRKTALLLRIGITAGYTYLTVRNLRTAAAN